MTPAAAPKQTIVTVRLDRSGPKKTVIRYDSPMDGDPALRSVYLANSAAAALGQPDAILITIEAAS